MTSTGIESQHVPVLVSEVIDALALADGATVGRRHIRSGRLHARHASGGGGTSDRASIATPMRSRKAGRSSRTRG